MNVFKLIIDELVGMFFDDELLAFAVLGVVAIAAIFSFVLHADSLLVGGLLVVGCVAVLAASALKGMRKA
jgi:hypothetical protein